MYDSESISKPWVYGGATWNREHVWPQSRLGTDATPSGRNIASDPHNLRAIIPTTNTSRLNRYFVTGSGEVGYTIGSDQYYPGDAHRGDVARILLYMAVRYKDILSLTQNPSGTEMGDIRVLYNWHLEDPVDDFEIQRNDVIYEHQGNRNPFIDRPEYFQPVWEYFMQKAQLQAQAIETMKNTIASYELNATRYVELKRQYI
jgi:endonuclease I